MEDTTSQPVERMSFLDRFLPVWIMLAMAAGLAIGRAVPGLSGVLERLEVGGISLPIALGPLALLRSRRLWVEPLVNRLERDGAWASVGGAEQACKSLECHASLIALRA